MNIRDARTHLKIADSCHDAATLADARRVSQFMIQGAYYDTFDKESALRINDIENGYTCAKYAKHLLADNGGCVTLSCDTEESKRYSNYGFWYQNFNTFDAPNPLQDECCELVGATEFERYRTNSILITDAEGKPTSAKIDCDSHIIKFNHCTCSNYNEANTPLNCYANAIPLLTEQGKMPLKFLPTSTQVYRTTFCLNQDSNGYQNISGCMATDSLTQPGYYWVVQLADKLKDCDYVKVCACGYGGSYHCYCVHDGDWLMFNSDHSFDHIHNDNFKGITNASTGSINVTSVACGVDGSICSQTWTTCGIIDSNKVLDILHLRGNTICTGRTGCGGSANLKYGTTNLSTLYTDCSTQTSVVTSVGQCDGIVYYQKQNTISGNNGLLDTSLSCTNANCNKIPTGQAVLGLMCHCIYTCVTNNDNVLKKVVVCTTKPHTIVTTTINNKSCELSICACNLKISCLKDDGSACVYCYNGWATKTVCTPAINHASSTTCFGLASTTQFGHAKSANNIGCVPTSITGAIGNAVCVFARADHIHNVGCIVHPANNTKGILYSNANCAMSGFNYGSGCFQCLLTVNSSGALAWQSRTTLYSETACLTTKRMNTDGSFSCDCYNACKSLTVEYPIVNHASCTTCFGLASTSLYGHAKAATNVGCSATKAGSAGSANCLFAKADHVHKASNILCTTGGNAGVIYSNGSCQINALTICSCNNCILGTNGSGGIIWRSRQNFTACVRDTSGNLSSVSFDGTADRTFTYPVVSHASSTSCFGLATTTLFGHAKAASNVGCASTATGNAGSANCLFAKADHAHLPGLACKAACADKVNQSLTFGSYTYNGSAACTITAGRISAVCKTGDTMTGDLCSTHNICLTCRNRGYFLMDNACVSYPGIYDNCSNLWIGASATQARHHVGGTFISSGYDSGTGKGKASAYISVPNTSNNCATNYAILHEGNYRDYVTCKAACADKINTDAGSLTQPVYFTCGVPANTTYSLSSSVPANAKIPVTIGNNLCFDSNKALSVKTTCFTPYSCAAEITKILNGTSVTCKVNCASCASKATYWKGSTSCCGSSIQPIYLLNGSPACTCTIQTNVPASAKIPTTIGAGLTLSSAGCLYVSVTCASSSSVTNILNGTSVTCKVNCASCAAKATYWKSSTSCCGSSIQPIYLLNGSPACTCTIQTNVPANAKIPVTIGNNLCFDSNKALSVKTTCFTPYSCAAVITNILNGTSTVCKANCASCAAKINTDAGSLTQPVYFTSGVPSATTYSLGSSVPANACIPTCATSKGGACQPIYISNGSFCCTTFTLCSNVPASAKIPTVIGAGLTLSNTGCLYVSVTCASSSSVTNILNGTSTACKAKCASCADKINTDAGNVTHPVYFSNGCPVTTTYCLCSSVPACACIPTCATSGGGACQPIYISNGSFCSTTFTLCSNVPASAKIPTTIGDCLSLAANGTLNVAASKFTPYSCAAEITKILNGTSVTCKTKCASCADEATCAFCAARATTACKAWCVADYNNTGDSIKIGWAGASLTTTNYFAAYTGNDSTGHCIKDISVDCARCVLGKMCDSAKIDGYTISWNSSTSTLTFSK